jgi:hypothetical protein
VFRFSGAYIYNLAAALRPLNDVAYDTPFLKAYLAITGAVGELENFVQFGTFGVRSCLPLGQHLLNVLKVAFERAQGDTNREHLDPQDVFAIAKAWTPFEAALKAELAVANLYWVTAKGAFDPTVLAENGVQAFPAELVTKVPGAEFDARQAARCIAFELPTAAAFHMHRLHEAVVHAYFKTVAPPGTTPPERSALEGWIKALEGLPKPNLKLIAAIRSIKDLHRNPVLHPQDTLSDVEEAISLLGAINSSVKTMLMEM